MDRQHQIILDMDMIMEVIDKFRDYGTLDEIIVNRLYYLAKAEKEGAQRKIDMKLDEMEEMYHGT